MKPTHHSLVVLTQYKARRVAEMRAWRASQPMLEGPVMSSAAVAVPLQPGSEVPSRLKPRIGGNLARPVGVVDDVLLN
jgi:hypothetical protein